MWLKVYTYNQQRLDEINDRLYERNLTNAPIKMQYDIRAVPTRYVHMPTVDQHQNVSVGCEQNQYTIHKQCLHQRLVYHLMDISKISM